MAGKIKVLWSIETLLFISLHDVISQRTLSIHYIYISINLKVALVDGIVCVKSANILQPWIFQYCEEIICFASFRTWVAIRIFWFQSGNQYNGTLPSINVVGSAGGSQESESSSGVGQSSGGDGVDGEEQEESSSSHVVCGI